MLNKAVKWIDIKLKSNELDQEKRVLDLGCGNGLFLFELSKLGFRHLRGVDYSENSIRFSNLILDRDYPQYKSNITFRQLNLLEPLEQQMEDHQNWTAFDLIHDKGTFDAICLNPDRGLTLDQLRAKYRAFLGSVLSSGGLFILCSCNWSKEELIREFVDDATLQLSLIDEIKQNSFVFGGKAGNTVTCLIFRRK